MFFSQLLRDHRALSAMIAQMLERRLGKNRCST